MPLNPYVRIIAALESMSGVFFVAVVVARLVSSYRPKPLAEPWLLNREESVLAEHPDCEGECATAGHAIKLPLSDQIVSFTG